ncbi:hypothetical protein AB5I41_25495 [Sphingomonas sp. MMS24-JH45]
MSASFTNQTLAQIELVDEGRPVQERGLRPPQAPRREGRGAAPREAGRAVVEADAEAGRVHRRAGRGAIQARPLSLLIDPEAAAREISRAAFPAPHRARKTAG